MRRQVVRRMLDHPYPLKCVRGLIPVLEVEQTAYPYSREPRAVGTSKYGMVKLTGLALMGLAVTGSRPMFLVMALLFLLFGVPIGVYLGIASLVWFSGLPGSLLLLLYTLIYVTHWHHYRYAR